MINQKQALVALSAILIGSLGLALWYRHAGTEATTYESSLPSTSDANVLAAPAISASPYLNTGPAVQYVGSDQCKDCHADANASYLATTHSRTLATAVTDNAPTDVSFLHEKSGRRFRVYRRNGQLRHQESLLAELVEEEEIVLCDLPVAYAIGSGNNAHSYLVEIDGFLCESPITWYANRNEWGPSPGYDRINHGSFSRLVDSECLQCHVGRFEPVSSSNGRLRFHEQKIGCENCHGPGALHVKSHAGSDVSHSDIDYTIVNPAHLSRELEESICAQCHLSGDAKALLRGRKLADFRPGLPLADFRIDYRLDIPNAPMTVAGHFMQMYASKCYTDSTTLTCTTCHNPHKRVAPGQEVEHYRTICLSCHSGDDGCTLPEPKRLAENSMNNCVACHMKQTDIQIPHLAFTHHRIGLEHSTKYEKPHPNGAPLIPIGRQNERLEPLDRKRCLAIAYYNYADSIEGPQSELYRIRARELLVELYASGLRDPQVTISLAWLHWKNQSLRFVELAEETLSDRNCPSQSRANALFLLAASHLLKREPAQAQEKLESLVELKLDPNYWILLANCQSQNRDYAGAVSTYKNALAILPQRPDVHVALAELYEKMGKPQLAADHRQMAKRFARLSAVHSFRPRDGD